MCLPMLFNGPDQLLQSVQDTRVSLCFARVLRSCARKKHSALETLHRGQEIGWNVLNISW